MHKKFVLLLIHFVTSSSCFISGRGRREPAIAIPSQALFYKVISSEINTIIAHSFFNSLHIFNLGYIPYKAADPLSSPSVPESDSRSNCDLPGIPAGQLMIHLPFPGNPILQQSDMSLLHPGSSLKAHSSPSGLKHFNDEAPHPRSCPPARNCSGFRAPGKGPTWAASDLQVLQIMHWSITCIT